MQPDADDSDDWERPFIEAEIQRQLEYERGERWLSSSICYRPPSPGWFINPVTGNMLTLTQDMDVQEVHVTVQDVDLVPALIANPLSVSIGTGMGSGHVQFPYTETHSTAGTVTYVFKDLPDMGDGIQPWLNILMDLPAVMRPEGSMCFRTRHKKPHHVHVHRPLCTDVKRCLLQNMTVGPIVESVNMPTALRSANIVAMRLHFRGPPVVVVCMTAHQLPRDGWDFETHGDVLADPPLTKHAIYRIEMNHSVYIEVPLQDVVELDEVMGEGRGSRAYLITAEGVRLTDPEVDEWSTVPSVPLCADIKRFSMQVRADDDMSRGSEEVVMLYDVLVEYMPADIRPFDEQNRYCLKGT
jgi:hypothetical protein